jgi:hypothetical protein
MKSADSSSAVPPLYDEMLKRDRRWAMDEGGRHFEGESLVQKNLRRIARRLDELDVP